MGSVRPENSRFCIFMGVQMGHQRTNYFSKEKWAECILCDVLVIRSTLGQAMVRSGPTQILASVQCPREYDCTHTHHTQTNSTTVWFPLEQLLPSGRRHQRLRTISWTMYCVYAAHAGFYSQNACIFCLLLASLCKVPSETLWLVDVTFTWGSGDDPHNFSTRRLTSESNYRLWHILTSRLINY